MDQCIFCMTPQQSCQVLWHVPWTIWHIVVLARLVLGMDACKKQSADTLQKKTLGMCLYGISHAHSLYSWVVSEYEQLWTAWKHCYPSHCTNAGVELHRPFEHGMHSAAKHLQL